MPKLELSAIPVVNRTGYPAVYAGPLAGRHFQRLGEAGGLTQFGVNLCRLKPGAASSQRHWHEKEDEFVVMLEGELVLVEEGGETIMRPGDCAAFKAGEPNGHHLVNRSGADGVFIVVGTHSPVDRAHYPDIDMLFTADAGGDRFTRKDGSPF